jgi:16S rRNA (guanine527-N7)-methyltransferase
MMPTDPHPDAALRDALAASQRSGFLGDRPVEEVIEHARTFVRALDGVESIAVPGGESGEDDRATRVLDLGSGGGVPGLVIAHDRPDLRVTLLDRRAKRTDFLERVVSRLGWHGRVTVICADVDTFTPPHRFDAVVARGFGPPERTLSVATELVRPGGRVVISEPPAADRWPAEMLESLGVVRRSAVGDPVAVFERR